MYGDVQTKYGGQKMKKLQTQNQSATLQVSLIVFQIVACILLCMGITFYKISELHAGSTDIAVETFTAKSWSAGTGWSDAWYHEGRADIISADRPHSGPYHMRLRTDNAWTDRPLNLSGYNNVRLGVYVKVKSFEKNDYAEFMIKSGDNGWETLRRFTPSDSDNRYHYYEFDLTPYGLTANVWIGFEAEMSARRDYLYIDDIRIFTETTPPPPVTNDDTVFGVTIDDISNASAIKDSLASLARRPFARIVFDEYVQPSYYKNTVADFHNVADVMGEILDSYYVQEYSQQDYEQRTRDYINAMADEVDIWEVGNEINGEWLGQGAINKAAAAYDIAKAAGEATALTLYYNGLYDNGEPTANNCWEKPEHQMHVWSFTHVPERMKQGLDWVLVSFYEEDCENISPDWDKVFSDLHAIFPNSKLGFGEVGSSNSLRKETILRRYYGMNRIRPEFVGGFFWWYFKQDMVPKTKDLWSILNEYALSWDEQYE
jgi:hypothetical protein